MIRHSPKGSTSTLSDKYPGDIGPIKRIRKGEAMSTAPRIMTVLACFMLCLLLLPGAAPAQDSTEPDQAAVFTSEELTQMLAPIALYPDSLIAQILMAATYPLEVVEAERWVRENDGLKGEALDKALLEKTWDVSVKSLCHFPDVIFALSEKLDQTRKLGDAFLAQEDDVMATIQDLRRRAREQGNLESSKQQKVVVEREVISIEPSAPDVVYVPIYNPLYVYGPWWYPAYPPWYWYYPSAYLYPGIYFTFGPPFYFYGGFFSWCWFDWHSHSIRIDYSYTRHYHRDRRFIEGRTPGGHVWKHEQRHRRGVAYRDARTSSRFIGRPDRTPSPGSLRRGYPSGGGRISVPDRGGSPSGRVRGTDSRTRPEERSRSVGRPERSAPPDTRTGSTPRERTRSIQRRDTPFRGVENGSFERRAGERGYQSRSSRQIQGGRSMPDRGGSVGGRTGGGSAPRSSGQGGGGNRYQDSRPGRGAGR